MPSQSEENTNLMMQFQTSASQFASAYGEGIADDVLEERFQINKFDWYFPDMHFMSDYIPLGTSKPYCMHVDWIKKE